MTERIGKITLDYTHYSGEDLYCDGAVEDVILELVRNLSPVEYGRAIEENESWPVLYHLSPLRENIVEWIPMERGSKVLEVGSGCGAITGALAAKAGSVTCVELSKKRSLINAYRHEDCDNVTIHVGNFKDIEPDLDRDFDYICLIGVFEYGAAYIGGETPYEDFLRILLRHLGKGGRLVIAIENQYGLKYFAGCREDHNSRYFSGIENYPEGGPARTFVRPGLEKIFCACGAQEYHFYYPYPDYKFMTTLHSDRRLPGKGELADNIRNFDMDRMCLFNERLSFDGIVEAGLYPVFANSYLVVLGNDFDIDYVKYSNDRDRNFAVRTQIDRERQWVRKYPMSPEAAEHIRSIQTACRGLEERYAGSGLAINKCRIAEDDNGCYAELEYVEGTPLSELMDACLRRGDQEGFREYFREYVKRIGYGEEQKIADYDLIFSNILVSGDTWTLIDYEWTFPRQTDTKELAFRAVLCYVLENEQRNALDLDWIMQELHVTNEQAQEYREQEGKFQKFVTGKRLSMGDLRALIGHRVLPAIDYVNQFLSNEDRRELHVYEDRGSGFSEETSYKAKARERVENLSEYTILVDRDVQRLRLDPGFCCCVIKILEMTWNGEEMPLARRKFLQANGRIFFPKEKGQRNHPTIVFADTDPNFTMSVQELVRREQNELRLKFELVLISQEMAGDVIR